MIILAVLVLDAIIYTCIVMGWGVTTQSVFLLK